MEELLPTHGGLRVSARMTNRESRTEITMKESRNTDTKARDVTNGRKGYLEDVDEEEEEERPTSESSGYIVSTGRGG